MTGHVSAIPDVEANSSRFSLPVRVFWALMASASILWLIDRQASGLLFLYEDGSPRWADFVTFWGAGKQVLAGNAALIYDKALHTQFLWSQFDRVIGTPMDYMYPPTSLLFVWPLGVLDYLPAWILYFLIGFFAFVAVLKHLAGDYLTALSMALAFGAAPYAIQTGQNAFYTAALLAAALALLPSHKVAAGFLIGLLTFKPQLALAAFAGLFVWREWRALSAAIATVLLLAVGATLAFGWTIWPDFLAPGSGLSDRVEVGQRPTQTVLYQSVYAFFVTRVGSLPALAVQALAAAVTMVVVWRIKGNDTRAAALIAATILVTPFSLFYDLVMLTAAAAFLLRAEPGRAETLAICAAIFILVLFFVFGHQIGLITAVTLLFLSWIIDNRPADRRGHGGNPQAL